MMRIRLFFVAALLLAMLQGWAAPAVINVNVGELDFGNLEVGYPVTKSFMVSGTNLQGDINLAIESRHDFYYEVIPETITPEEAAGGAVVRLKCLPISDYLHGATLRLTSQDAEDVLIPITATAYYPDMFVNNRAENFTAFAGGFSRRTGVVRFADAEIPPTPGTDPVLRAVHVDYIVPDYYSISVEGADASQFGARIVRGSFLTNICTVEITYVPRCIGTHSATLKLYCSRAGVPQVTIPLRGEAAEVLGDLNGDGVLGVGDVTGFINLMLSNGEIPSRVDLDSNGSIDISDITILVNRLLNAAE